MFTWSRINPGLNNFEEQLEGFLITQDKINDPEIKDFFIVLAKGRM